MTKTNIEANKKNKSSMMDFNLIKAAIKDSFVKLNPRKQLENPVMFLVFLGALVTSVIFINEVAHGTFNGFNFQIMIWLWFTVLFANFAEAIAEGRGKAQADSLRKLKTDTFARLYQNGKEERVISSKLQLNDIVICEAEDIIPADGEVIEGIATVDESAITGESAPVIRESGGDRSAVTGGTKVLSDRILVKVTAEQGNSFIDKMIALVEGAKRKKTPNEIALSNLLIGLTIVFVLAVLTLYPFANYAEMASGDKSALSITILTALLVCLIPTTISGLLSAIGISGMDRLIRHNVIAKSGKAVEAAGDIDVLLLDKTGTITLGNRMASDFYPTAGITENHLAEISQLASLSDDTPEGRSIVILAKEKFNIRGRDLSKFQIENIPFTAQTRMSGIDLITNNEPTTSIRKGAAEAVKNYVTSQGNEFPEELENMVTKIALEGSTPLVVAENGKAIGIIKLKDVVKGGIKERFEQLRKMGIKTVMITGDNPLTASAIAAEAGVDEYSRGKTRR